MASLYLLTVSPLSSHKSDATPTSKTPKLDHASLLKQSFHLFGFCVELVSNPLPVEPISSSSLPIGPEQDRGAESSKP